MAAMKKALSSDPDYYTKSFELFCKKSNIEQCKHEWFQNNFPDVMKPIISRWQSLPPHKVKDVAVRVFGIGSAEGKFDFRILDIIADGLLKGNTMSTEISLFNRVVEPSSSSITSFKASSAAWSCKKPNVNASFEPIPATFQDYAMSERDSGQFQLIHFLNSIYYMKAEEALCYCMDKELAGNGVILLLTITENSFWFRFAKRFHDNGICPSPPGFTLYSSEYLISVAEKYNWRYELHRLKYWLNAAELFDESSDSGSLLADFLTHIINFRGVTEKGTRDAVMQFWEEEAKLQEDGRRLMWCESGILFIHK